MDPLLQIGAQFGITGLFLSIMYMAFRTQLKNEREEKTFYRDKFFDVIGVVDRQTSVVGKLVEPVREHADVIEKVEAAATALAAEVASLRRGG